MAEKPTSTLEEMCELIVDRPHFTPEWTENGYIVIRNQNIRKGRLDLSQPSFTHRKDFERRIKRAKPREGDIIFTREAPMGEVCMVPKGLECCVGQRQVLVRPKPDIDSRYLFFAIQSPFARHQIFWNEGTGSTVSNVRIPALKSLRIPRAGQEESAIAEIPEALDRKIDLNRQTNETLEATARAIFKDWFVDFGPTRAKAEGRDPYLAPEIWELFPDALDDEDKPVGWKQKPLDEIADFLNGLALQKFPASDPFDSLPVIKIAELRAGLTAKTNRASREVPQRYVVQDGDFLFSWSGSLLAKFWTHGEGALNQHLFKVTSQQHPSWFFSQCIYHHLEAFQAIAASKATTMGHIQRGHLKAAMTTCPPDEVFSTLGLTMAPLIERTIKNELESRALAETRDFLLPKLMSGEIRLRDAEKAVEAVA